MNDKIYTSGEVAKITGVNFRTVIRWIERGELEGYKLPGRGDHRVTQDALVFFMKKHGMPIPDEVNQSDVKRSVLVVDDEQAMANAIARVFKRDGWQVHIAEDGFQAGAMLMKYKPLLMTLDLRMPGMDGFEVLKFTRENFLTDKLKIIVVSAQPEQDLIMALKEGADAIFEKPFENSDLLQKAKRLVDSQAA